MIFVPFEAGHLHQLKLQPAQAYLSSAVTEEELGLEQHPSHTAMRGSEVLGCAGVIEQWEGRGTAWALIGETGPKDFITIHRAVKRFLDVCYFKRIELTVDCDFPAGHRWAKMLGFDMECERMVAYGPKEKDASLYSRVQ
tara:strand:+ start:182 stop:601 length:420 start_codon:yes stop_codon:yes gene_type:complete